MLGVYWLLGRNVLGYQRSIASMEVVLWCQWTPQDGRGETTRMFERHQGTAIGLLEPMAWSQAASIHVDRNWSVD